MDHRCHSTQQNLQAATISIGSGEMTAWGVTYLRTWKIEDNQVCIEIDAAFQCYTVEQNIDNQDVTESEAST